MTVDPGMRELAQRLLAYEATAGKTSEPVGSPTLRVYEKLRKSLGVFVGAVAFHSLACRALTLTRSESFSLGAASIAEDGTLLGHDRVDGEFDSDNDQAGEGGTLLIARLLGLLRIFLGEALTLSLLRNAWPGDALDDLDSDHWRNHD